MCKSCIRVRERTGDTLGSIGIRFLRGTGGLQRSLAALHAQRDDADYDIGKTIPAGAQEALRFAREFIRRVEEKIRERERQEKR
jgi:hypothetical protein